MNILSRKLRELERNVVSDAPDFKTLSIHFFDEDTANESMSLRENLIQGRVNSEIHGAQDKVDDVIIRVMREEGFIDEMVLMGLEYAVGEGGRFLSGGQSMKVAIARICKQRIYINIAGPPG